MVDKDTLRKRLAEKRKLNRGGEFRGKPKTDEHKQKLAAWWTPEQRLKQAEVARSVNANPTLRDYICPDCGEEFEQVRKEVYGGHRKKCLYWKRVQAWLEEDEGKLIDEILD
jgi:hypothetical protein